MDYYESWALFVSNIDIVPDELDGEKLIRMVSSLSCTRAERESLGRAAADGDKTSLESFLNAYIPMIVESMKNYSPSIGYHRDILMNCVERVREKVANTLYLDDLESIIAHYVDWMVKNEVTQYIASQEKLLEEHPDDENIKALKGKTTEELLEKINASISDKKQAEIFSALVRICRNDRERQLLAFRMGLEDGVPKTLQETAEKFKISSERARQIEKRVVQRYRVAVAHLSKGAGVNCRIPSTEGKPCIGKIDVRIMNYADIPSICKADQDESESNIAYFRRQLDHQRNRECSALLAQYNGETAGYVFLYYQCRWGSLAGRGLPSVVDLRVFEKYRRNGIATALMDAAEEIAKGCHHKVYLDVCLNREYGPAQRLYIKRGYVPDGEGLYYAGKICEVNEVYRNDDEMTLCLVKELFN